MDHHLSRVRVFASETTIQPRAVERDYANSEASPKEFNFTVLLLLCLSGADEVNPESEKTKFVCHRLVYLLSRRGRLDFIINMRFISYYKICFTSNKVKKFPFKFIYDK